MRTGSFVRKGAAAAAAADPRTRPGLHGQTLLSTGHSDFDRLLGGGLPLGALLLVLEDGWSTHHATLLKYFLAEGAACGQSVLLAAAPPAAGGLQAFIPAQLKSGRSAADKAGEEGGPEDEFKLRIAWQYRRYIKTGQQGASSASTSAAGGVPGGGGVGASRGSSAAPSSGSSSAGARKPAGLRDWCHQFDLLKPAGEEGLAHCRAETVDCSPEAQAEGSGGSCGSGPAGPASGTASTQRLVAAAGTFVQSLQPQQQPAQQPGGAAGVGGAVPRPAALPPSGPQHVGRLAVLSLGSLGWQLPEPAGTAGNSGTAGASPGTAVLRALLHLKGIVRDQRCAAVVTVPPALFSASDLTRMQHIADCVVALESVADDSDIVRLAPDAASVAGLLHLRKLPGLGTAVPPAADVALHLIRHKRRRLSITPVEIDPDAEMADSEAASGLGRSVASVLCGGPPKADRAVDF